MALVSNHCQKQLKGNFKVSLINDDKYIGLAFCNFYIFGNLEEIHLAKGNRTNEISLLQSLSYIH